MIFMAFQIGKGAEPVGQIRWRSIDFEVERRLSNASKW
jgi:hypothetical protein